MGTRITMRGAGALIATLAITSCLGGLASAAMPDAGIHVDGETQPRLVACFLLLGLCQLIDDVSRAAGDIICPLVGGIIEDLTPADCCKCMGQPPESTRASGLIQ